MIQERSIVKVDRMASLRLAALCFMFPGLAGSIISSMISVSYLANLPKLPDPQQMRMTPREIHRITVYQTLEEKRQVNEIEYSSSAIFIVGLALSPVYLRKWGIARALEGKESELEYVRE